jgi:hypothetical protein
VSTDGCDTSPFVLRRRGEEEKGKQGEACGYARPCARVCSCRHIAAASIGSKDAPLFPVPPVWPRGEHAECANALLLDTSLSLA